MNREQYASDRARASYFWEARRGDVVIACEYGPDGTEYPLRTIPGLIPTPQGEFCLAAGAPSVSIHARAYRSDMPSYALVLEPGETLLWSHKVCEYVAINGPRTTIEVLVFGKRDIHGRENVIQVYPNGFAEQYDSYQAAVRDNRRL